jgi:hypothetical protein
VKRRRVEEESKVKVKERERQREEKKERKRSKRKKLKKSTMAEEQVPVPKFNGSEDEFNIWLFCAEAYAEQFGLPQQWGVLPKLTCLLMRAQAKPTRKGCSGA